MRIAVFALGLFAVNTQASMPDFDLYLADLKDNKAIMAISILPDVPYVNQPAFNAQGDRLYFTQEEPLGQTQIGVYEVNAGQHRVLADTPLSEYSPTLLPDGSGLSVVVVEEDSTQRLWKIDWQGNASLYKPKVKGVGYHSWGANKDALLFILGEEGASSSIQYLTHKDQLHLVSHHVGRALAWQPSGHFAAFTVQDKERLLLNFFDSHHLQTHETRIALPEGAQDILWLADGRILASGPKGIYQIRTGDLAKNSHLEVLEQEFTLLWNLTEMCQTQVSRFALNTSHTKLAFVCQGSD